MQARPVVDNISVFLCFIWIETSYILVVNGDETAWHPDFLEALISLSFNLCKISANVAPKARTPMPSIHLRKKLIDCKPFHTRTVVRKVDVIAW